MTTTSKPNYTASSSLTITNLHSLPNSSTLVAGWSCAVQDNTSNLYGDVVISGNIITGTSPTAGNTIEIWAWSILDDTPTYPDAITGSESGSITLTSANVKNSGAFKYGDSFQVDSTTNRTYPFWFTLTQCFGLMVPRKWGLFIANGSGVALKSSGSAIWLQPANFQNV